MVGILAVDAKRHGRPQHTAVAHAAETNLRAETGVGVDTL